MKYRAICPKCGIKISRALFFIAPSLPHKCKECNCIYRSNPLWEWIGDFVFAAPCVTVALLALRHHLSWKIASVLILFVLVLAYALFPYLTPFILAKEKSRQED
jgi:hypothetical protein